MDQTDRKILRILAENAAVTATEMVPQVNLSIPAINKRIQKLRESGVIRRFTVLVEPEAVGKPITAFILIVLQPGTGLERLMTYVRSDSDILECCGVTGEYDYLLKVCAASVAWFASTFILKSLSRPYLRKNASTVAQSKSY